MGECRIASPLSAGGLERLLAQVYVQDVPTIRELLGESCIRQALAHHRALLASRAALATPLLGLDQALLRQGMSRYSIRALMASEAFVALLNEQIAHEYA